MQLCVIINALYTQCLHLLKPDKAECAYYFFCELLNVWTNNNVTVHKNLFERRNYEDPPFLTICITIYVIFINYSFYLYIDINTNVFYQIV